MREFNVLTLHFNSTHNSSFSENYSMSIEDTSASKGALQNLFDKINPKIKKNLENQGITLPTSIQTKAYDPILDGKDVIAQSRTGSGKTIAFGLGAFTKLGHAGSKNPRILVLTPTRELADQIAKVFNETFQVIGFRTLAITGGKSYKFQKSVLSRGVDAIVATPGRFCDLLAQKSISLEKLEILVLDEMDEMLDFGFSEDILKIKQSIGKKIQTLLFSATFPKKVEAVVKQMVSDPIKISTNQEDLSTGQIEHEFLEVRKDKSIDALLGLLLYYNPEHAIIFCRTREETKNVFNLLSAQGFASSVLNGEMNQRDRSETMDRFKRKSIRLLIATDVAARGIDVSGLSHVINLNVPGNTDAYTHRAGRTGRAGASGKSWTIVVYNQRREYQTICTKLKINPTRLSLPNPKEMIETLLKNKLNKLKQRDASTSNFVKNSVEEYTTSLTASEAFVVLKDILVREMQAMLGHFPGTANIVPAELTEFGTSFKPEKFTRSRNSKSGSFRERRESKTKYSKRDQNKSFSRENKNSDRPHSEKKGSDKKYSDKKYSDKKYSDKKYSDKKNSSKGGRKNERVTYENNSSKNGFKSKKKDSKKSRFKSKG